MRGSRGCRAPYVVGCRWQRTHPRPPPHPRVTLVPLLATVPPSPQVDSSLTDMTTVTDATFAPFVRPVLLFV
ncbi:predicted protein [Streptomyces viridosporus ATCC 14672]|uniref:Predicted protein n=1 Tax=Streptomyces viridosporus (strain ATCC 14672 / DSM 40746 / JCM 4963 / KCTC 9882 / NRRL B-12104 / FH 1290) TaxID=566461 RepID=D5ZX45_STRV1|nr:predicted protein [Streptomyces viridosporus ATCC 14672]